MAELIVSLLPYIVGSAVVPVYIVIVVLLLKSPRRGLSKGLAYVSGVTATRLLQGLVFGLVFSESAALVEGGGKGPVLSAFLLIFGVVLLVTAARQWKSEDAADGPPPAWLTRLDEVSPLKAFGIGAGLPLIGVKQWVFTLGALATIAAAELGQPDGAVAYLLFVGLAQSLLLILIAIRILVPGQSQAMLNRISDWLSANSRVIAIAVALVFGLLFAYAGISGLLAS